MTENKRTLGIIFIIGAAFFFALMSLSVRLAGDLPIFEKMFFRNIVALIFSFAIVFKNSKNLYIIKNARADLFFRALAGTMGVICNFYAVDHMNIADASMLNKLSPFFAIMASYFLLKEKSRSLDWLFTILAFVGAGFVAKPSFSIQALPAFIAIAGGFSSGLAYTFVRRAANKGVRGELIIFYFSLFSTIFSGLMMLNNFKLMSIIQLIILICTGLFAMGGQICVTKAYTYAPAKEISTFDYTNVIFSALLGMVFLGQIPDIYSIIGYIIIISMAILKLKFNKKGN